jgi:tRNA wybutosine-synthesizing protein 4
MANILTQIVGEKDILIFPPSMVKDLDLPAGASSSRIPNIFATPLRERGLSAILRPGDAVYIPPLWPHATRPLTPNIGVNVFWKSFKDEVYDKGKDIYGNKDLVAYSGGRKGVDRIVRGFKGLDRDTREFYLKRLAAELEDHVNQLE